MKLTRLLRGAFFLLLAVLLAGYFRLHSLIPGFSYSAPAEDLKLKAPR